VEKGCLLAFAHFKNYLGENKNFSLHPVGVCGMLIATETGISRVSKGCLKMDIFWTCSRFFYASSLSNEVM